MINKVLFTASTYSHLYNFHRPYLHEFKHLGWEVHIACGGRNYLFTEADMQFNIPFKKSICSLSNIESLFKLHRIIKKEKYSLIVAHTSLASFFTRMALVGLKARPKTINVVHGYLFTEKTGRFKYAILKYAEKAAASFTDLTLTMNDYDYKWALSNNVSATVRKIPGMGVDPSSLRCNRTCIRTHSDSFNIVYAAEFSKRKNQTALIKAMILLPESVKLILAGEGTELENCKKLVTELGLNKRVIFPGYVQDVSDLFEKADIAVSSSLSEGLPFFIMEAMLYGLPVAASRIKGHSDLITDEVTGFLFDPDIPDSICDSIKKLIFNQENARAMASNARQKIDNYTLDSVKDIVMKEYLSPFFYNADPV